MWVWHRTVCFFLRKALLSSRPCSQRTHEMLELGKELGIWKLLPVKMMSIRITWQEGRDLKKLLGSRIPRFHLGFHTGMQAVFLSPSTRAGKLLFTPVMALHRSLIPGWKAKHVCGKAKQACEAKQNEEHFYYCFGRQGWLGVCLGFFNDCKRHLNPYFFGNSKIQLLLQVLTPLTNVYTGFLKNTLSFLGLFRPN